MKFLSKGRKIDTDSIRDRLVQVIQENELSQQDVADMTGLTLGMINHLYKGRREFTIETCCRICKALDIDLIWFITGLK